MEVTAGMKELLTYIARNLVDHPDAVSVTEHKGESETVLELRVAPEDMGKVIGLSLIHISEPTRHGA